MSKYQWCNTNALFDPYCAIKATGTFSESFLKTVFAGFHDIIYPLGMETYSIINEFGGEETITMPPKTRFTNWSCSHKCVQHIFPYIYYNGSNKIGFYIGNDAIQVTNHEDFYVYAYLKNEITYFNIIMIHDGKLVLIELSDADSEVRYYELSSDKIKNVKDFLGGMVFLIEPESYESLLQLYTDVPVLGRHIETSNTTSIAEKVRTLISDCLNSPKTIIGKIEHQDSQKPYFNSWPNLEINHRVSNILKKNLEAIKITKYFNLGECVLPGHYCRRSSDNSIEELYFYFHDAKSDIYCYVIPEKCHDNDEKEREYLVLYFYDTATVAAFEKMLGTHLGEGAYLFLQDAVESGLYPCCVSYEVVDNVQEAMEKILGNPGLITARDAYKRVLLRPCQSIDDIKK